MLHVLGQEPQLDSMRTHWRDFVPALVERRWYHYLVHSRRATLLKGLLLGRSGEQVGIINALAPAERGGPRTRRTPPDPRGPAGQERVRRGPPLGPELRRSIHSA